MAREYTLTVETSENTREISEGVTKEMYNATITKVETGQTISIVDVVNTYDRDDWCKTVFEHAKEGLDSEEGPDCCYVNASYVD